MTKNLTVEDTSPNNQTASDIKPQNQEALDITPQNSTTAFDFGTERFYTIVTARGQSMGLLLALTYSVAGTFQSSKSP